MKLNWIKNNTFVKFFTDRDRLQDSGKSRPRNRRETLRRLKKEGGDLDGDGDSEAAMDDFADQLAEKMLQEGGDVDVDIDDEDEDNFDDFDDEDFEDFEKSSSDFDFLLWSSLLCLFSSSLLYLSSSSLLYWSSSSLLCLSS